VLVAPISPPPRIAGYIRSRATDGGAACITALEARLDRNPSVLATSDPPFSSAMLEIFEVTRQLSARTIKDGDHYFADGIVASEFIVASMMVHGMNAASEIVARGTGGLVNSWCVFVIPFSDIGVSTNSS
jgi:hypothetical protein